MDAAPTTLPGGLPRTGGLLRRNNSRVLDNQSDAEKVQLVPDEKGVISVDAWSEYLEPLKDEEDWVHNDVSQGCQRCRRAWRMLARRRQLCR